MTNDPLAQVSTTATPQSEPATRDQVENSAGGYAFPVSDEARVKRFLTLGTDGGTYYASERELTRENAGIILDWAENRSHDLTKLIMDISVAGRAPRNQPALFALAAAAKLGTDVNGRRSAHGALSHVARTGFHLEKWAGYVGQFGGWGRGTRQAVANWYQGKPLEAAAYQILKYKQREGWSHRDLLRKAHPHPWKMPEKDPETGARITLNEDDARARERLYKFVTDEKAAKESIAWDEFPDLVAAYLRAQTIDPGNPEGVASLVTDYRLSWEMLPDWALKAPVVWEALIDTGIPATALMRQLPRLTNLGLLDPMGERTGQIAAMLADPERLRKGRVHPINVLVALRTYAAGHGERGSMSWDPSRPIVDALDSAFYASFGTVAPTKKRLMLALDVSGSMSGRVSGLPVSCREAAAAVALVTANVESQYEIVGFTTSGEAGDLHGWGRRGSNLSRRVLNPLSISPRQRLDDVVRYTGSLPFGGTDCALPMIDAMERQAEIDAFVIITDSETWAGSMHPHQALVQYRRKTGIDAKMVVVAMTSNGFSIADPNDAGSLDVVGFDSAAPNLISDFIRGDV